MFKFRSGYFATFLLLLLVEVFIALYVHDRWLRPYGGDSLAVVLVYAGLSSVLRGSVDRLVRLSFAIACCVELLQLFQLTSRWGLSQHAAVRTLLGTSFDVGDLFAYAVGALAVVAFERQRERWRFNASGVKEVPPPCVSRAFARRRKDGLHRASRLTVLSRLTRGLLGQRRGRSDAKCRRFRRHWRLRRWQWG